MASRRSPVASQAQIDRFNDYVDRFNAQIKAIEEADPDSVVLDRYRGAFEKIKGPMNARAVSEVFRDLKDTVESGRLSLDSVERSKENALKTIRDDYGFDFVNQQNLNQLFRFLDDARARHLHSVYSSEQIIEAIKEAKRKGLTEAQLRRNMDRWAKKVIKYDKQGKIIEVENPPKLNVRRVTLRRKRS